MRQRHQTLYTAIFMADTSVLTPYHPCKFVEYFFIYETCLDSNNKSCHNVRPDNKSRNLLSVKPRKQQLLIGFVYQPNLIFLLFPTSLPLEEFCSITETPRQKQPLTSVQKPVSKNIPRNWKMLSTSVSGIRIRMLLVLPDPDPLVRGADQDPSLFS